MKIDLKTILFIIMSCVAILGISNIDDVISPTVKEQVFTPHGKNESFQQCGHCHQGPTLSGHDQFFITKNHGKIANMNRAACLECHHEQNDCQKCHQDKAPEWASEGMLHPGKSYQHLQEHFQLGVAHKSACRECHVEDFVPRCQSCHSIEELDHWRPQ